MKDKKEEVVKTLVNLAFAMAVSGQKCSVCGIEFNNQDKDVVCSGKNPVQYAHVECWEYWRDKDEY